MAIACNYLGGQNGPYHRRLTVDPKTEEYFRQAIAAAWEALQKARPDSEIYRERFVAYCRLLYQASEYNREAKRRGPKLQPGRAAKQ